MDSYYGLVPENFNWGVKAPELKGGFPRQKVVSSKYINCTWKDKDIDLYISLTSRVGEDPESLFNVQHPIITLLGILTTDGISAVVSISTSDYEFSTAEMLSGYKDTCMITLRARKKVEKELMAAITAINFKATSESPKDYLACYKGQVRRLCLFSDIWRGKFQQFWPGINCPGVDLEASIDSMRKNRLITRME